MPLGGGISSTQRFYSQGVPITPGIMAAPAAPVVTSPATPIPGSLTGVSTSEGASPVGYKPVVPDPLKAIEDAINAYTSKLSSLQAAATKQTEANQALALKEITDPYPQFMANTNQIGQNISDWSQGLLTPENVAVATQGIMQKAAGRGMSSASPAVNAALRRVLGLQSYQLQQNATGQQNAVLSGLPKTTPVSVSSLGITPENLFSSIFGAQQLANLYAAAPNPADAYNLAMQNAQRGLTAGGAAGRGPYAVSPGGEGTADPNTMAMLQALINRGTGMAPSASAYYTPDITAPTPAEVGTADSAIYGSPENTWDYLFYEGPYAGDYVAPTETTPAPVTSPPWTDEEYWNNFYFGG